MNTHAKVLMLKDSWSLQRPMIHEHAMLVGPAKLAFALLERWGQVAGAVDGEDAAGRQKIRETTPQEAVTRACDVAEAFWQETQRRGWILEVPEPVAPPAQERKTEAPREA